MNIFDRRFFKHNCC